MKEKAKKYGYINNLIYTLSTQWKFDKKYIIALLVEIPFSCINSLVAAILPKIVLDCVENKLPLEQLLLRVGGASIILLLCVLILNSTQSYGNASLNLIRLNLYRNIIFEKQIDMDYNNYVYSNTRILKAKANDSWFRMNNDISNYIAYNKDLFASLFGFLAFAGIISNCSIWFIPIILLSYIFSYIGWMIFQKYKDKLKYSKAKNTLQLNYVVFRSKDFSNSKDIRTYKLIDYLITKMDHHLAEQKKLETKENNGHLINVLLEDVLKFLISFCAYAYLINLKINTEMSIGDFVLYFGAITGFGSWLSKVVDSISSLVESNHRVNDFRSYIDIPDKMNRNKGLSNLSKTNDSYNITLEDLTFCYDGEENPIIDNLNLHINHGEKIAIVGTNGAGKSTLVKLISGLFIPKSGTIYINGIESSKFNRDQYYEMFTTVFQDVSLLPTTIEKNIALCKEDEIKNKKLWECIKLAGLYEKINSLEKKEKTLLISEINNEATAFSGGELQKLILARALYKDSPIIILDEPTAALDPIAENKMYVKFNELTRKKTTIFISHRLSSTRFCDRILLLDKGGIAEEGSHEELMALDGQYANMFRIQSHYYKESHEGLL